MATSPQLSPRVRQSAAAVTACALVFVLSCALAGCSVILLSGYDEVTDRQVADLTTRTETFLAHYAAVTDETGRIARPGKPYDSAAAGFYDEARGLAAALLLRAQEKAHNQDEIDILTRLDGRYLALQKSQQLGPLTQTSASGLRRSLRALTHVQLTKKHLAAPANGGAP